MKQLVTTAALALGGLAVLAAASPYLVRLVGALVPLVIVVGLVAGMLRLVWFYTRNRW